MLCFDSIRLKHILSRSNHSLVLGVQMCRGTYSHVSCVRLNEIVSTPQPTISIPKTSSRGLYRSTQQCIYTPLCFVMADSTEENLENHLSGFSKDPFGESKAAPDMDVSSTRTGLTISSGQLLLLNYII